MSAWINSCLGLLTPAQWEAWRNWLATIGGLVALLIAANTYRLNVRSKREAQARLVYSKVTDIAMRQPGEQFTTLRNGAQMGNGSPGMERVQQVNQETGLWDLARALAPLLQATVIIHNGSNEIIGPARVNMIHGVSREVWYKFSITVAEIEPDSNAVVEFTWINDAHPGFPPSATTLLFRDSSAQWWRRVRSDPIERVHNDPENTAHPAGEREATRAYQHSIGVPPEQQVAEPRVGPITRWHRLARRVRGKNPIP